MEGFGPIPNEATDIPWLPPSIARVWPIMPTEGVSQSGSERCPRSPPPRQSAGEPTDFENLVEPDGDVRQD